MLKLSPGMPERETRERVAACAVVLALLVAAFAAGRFTAREPDVHETESVTVVQQVWSSKTYARATDRAVSRHIVAVAQPDGSSVTTIDEHEATHIDEHGGETAGARTDATRVATRDVITPLPDWRLGAHVGAAATFGPTLAFGLEVGGDLERRLWGPLVGGFYFSVRPGPTLGVSAGLSARLEF